MASQARDAYLAGGRDQTHLEIEELLESLKLVGGLGVGPTIAGVRSNRLRFEAEVDGAGGRSDVNRASLSAGSRHRNTLVRTEYIPSVPQGLADRSICVARCASSCPAKYIHILLAVSISWRT